MVRTSALVPVSFSLHAGVGFWNKFPIRSPSECFNFLDQVSKGPSLGLRNPYRPVGNPSCIVAPR